MILAVIGLIVLATLPASFLACKAAPGWEHWSMERRLYLADIVVHGKVLQHIFKNTSSSPSESRHLMDINFQVYCVYKGDHNAISENITIVDNYLTSCFHSDTVEGKDYIVMLIRRTTDGKYVLQEMNLQGAVFPVSVSKDEIHSALMVCGLQSPNEPSDRPNRLSNSTVPFCDGIAVPAIYPPPTITCTTGGSEIVVSNLFGWLFSCLVSLSVVLLLL